jgi:hypothetical protein
MPRPRRPLPALLGLLPLVFAAPAVAADITFDQVITPSGSQSFVFIEGPIEVGDWSRFMKLLRAHPDLRAVALESEGGSLDDGLAIARQIHERQLDTALISTCHSVCSIMFLAGDERFVPPNFSLTVHSAYKQIGNYTARDHNANGTVAWFLGSMGYPLALARLWSSTAPEDAAAITWAMNDKWDLGFQPIDPLVTFSPMSYSP